MIIRGSICLAALILVPAFGAERLPHVPTPAPRFADRDERPARVRVKVSAFSSLNVADRQVRLGGLVLCSASACYQPETPPYIDLRTTSAPGAPNIADVLMPPTTITRVDFSPLPGGAGLEGSLVLDPPLTLDKDVYSSEIMLVVAKRGSGAKAGYAPLQAAVGLLGPGPEMTAVHYIPNSATVVRLPLGVGLTLPAGALPRPAVFSAAVYDTGGKFPQVDVYPYVHLALPGIIEMSAIARPPVRSTANGRHRPRRPRPRPHLLIRATGPACRRKTMPAPSGSRSPRPACSTAIRTASARGSEDTRIFRRKKRGLSHCHVNCRFPANVVQCGLHTAVSLGTIKQYCKNELH